MSAGRPTKYDEEMRRKLISLPPHMIDFAKELGDGVLAEGVRECIKREMERQDDNT